MKVTQGIPETWNDSVMTPVLLAKNGKKKEMYIS